MSRAAHVVAPFDGPRGRMPPLPPHALSSFVVPLIDGGPHHVLHIVEDSDSSGLGVSTIPDSENVIVPTLFAMCLVMS